MVQNLQLNAKILHIDGRCYRTYAEKSSQKDPSAPTASYNAARVSQQPATEAQQPFADFHNSQQAMQNNSRQQYKNHEAQNLPQTATEDKPPGFEHISSPQSNSAQIQSNLPVQSKISKGVEKANRVFKFTASLQVDPEVVGFLIGAKGATKKRIEEETATQIKTVGDTRRRGDQDNIIISAETEEALSLGKNAVKQTIIEATNSPRLSYNYFISIPVNTEDVQQSFSALKTQILALDTADQCKIDESIFISAKKLHLTVLVLKLYSNESRALASEVLKGLKSKIISLLGNQPLSIRLGTLKSMSENVSKTDVLYMGLQEGNDDSSDDSSSKLKEICQEVTQAYKSAGFASENRDLLLHSTTSNTKYRKVQEDSAESDTENSKRKSHKRQRFPKRIQIDAQPVLDSFGDFSFGDIHLKSLELSQMSAVDETGYYKCLTKLQLPDL